MQSENAQFCQEMRQQLSDIKNRINRLLPKRNVSPIKSSTSSTMSEQSQQSAKSHEFIRLSQEDDIQKNIAKINSMIMERRQKTEQLLKYQY
ncbi:unnamed protein product [Paramecium sonneborni]|uniref:Uncharacterized protein n=1 Tax=Paramecium sonneborni TaxID=65129 RepID=A0A8S1QTZ8_9CILI|nr:unnamed protein product [Paramecium sonneborni]CAD8119113.1 unnamed protein product [Paramecium sonneborni]